MDENIHEDKRADSGPSTLTVQHSGNKRHMQVSNSRTVQVLTEDIVILVILVNYLGLSDRLILFVHVLNDS